MSSAMQIDRQQLLIRTPDGVTDEWVAAVVDDPAARLVSVERIGTGQMSQSHRLTFTVGDGATRTVVVKLASDNERSRATGVGMGAYAREIAFYRRLAGRIGGPLAACRLAVYDDDEGWFTLVLADAVDAQVGDQIAGCDAATARIALRALARIHAPVLNDLSVGTSEYLNLPNPLNQALLQALLPGFLDRYGDRIAPEHADLCRRFVAVADAWAGDRRPPLGLVHGDYRLDNLLFTPDGCTVVDWQTVTWGPAMIDVAYFVGGGLDPAERREHEQDLVRSYFDELQAQGVQNFAWETCWAEYRRQTFHALVMTIAAAMVTEQTARGDEMFMTWLARIGRQIIDLDAVSLLPQPGAAPVALEPDAVDDAVRHEPGPEPLWNESWYFDVVDDTGTIGAYVRLGRLPNQGCSFYTAAVVRPGQSALMLIDTGAPLPASDDDSQTLHTDGYHAEQHCLEPLRTYRVTVRGTTQAHTDQAAPLRGEAGEPVRLALDLVWQTDGVPYLWRQSTRYEIPCRVTGTIRIGDEEFTVTGAGQRDHSWGSRDWWANDWMWSAFHLDDGTHTHAVTVPQLPGFAVGYTQRDGTVTEIGTGTATEQVAPDGLVTGARVVTGPDELDLEVEPLAFGALRLVAPDGRVAHFPRAMARVRAADGRQGVGWIEWNRNQA